MIDISLYSFEEIVAAIDTACRYLVIFGVPAFNVLWEYYLHQDVEYRLHPKNYRSVNAVKVIYCIILLGFIIYTLITSNRLFIFGVIYIMVEMTQLFYRKRLISEYWRSKPSIKKEKELLDSLVTLIEFKAICNIIIIFALLDALGVIS